ncbi:amino acid racemase [candidate division WOR-3 bacterium]|nr:amino acid racemase [candidate division WOR-3 bacterium]
MKKIGIIGGLGPESTIDYYRIICQNYRERTGGQYPHVIIYSLNFMDFPCTGSPAGLDDIATWLVQAAQTLHKAGADFALIAANTPHIVFDEVEKRSPIPCISIVEETCRVACSKGLKHPGLLGTRTTMEAHFYQNVFSAHGINIVVPRDAEKEYLNDKITGELMYNSILETTRQDFLTIIERLVREDSIDGLILGCTEIPLLLTQDAFGIPFLNTTLIHALAAVDFSLS